MLAQALYYSTPCIAYGGLENLDVLASARRHNIENKITGFLFRTPDRFIQMLEGEHDAVRDTMARIRRDFRHTDIVTLPVMVNERRQFSSWLMGYADAVAPDAFDPIIGPDRDAFTMQEKRTRFIEQTRPYINPSQQIPIESDQGEFYDAPMKTAKK